MALALLASVRSAGGLRRLPPRTVPTATGSYAAHASYMQVCAIASARATIGGPLRRALLRRTSASAALFQSLTAVAEAALASSTPATNVAAAGRTVISFGTIRRKTARSMVTSPQDVRRGAPVLV